MATLTVVPYFLAIIFLVSVSIPTVEVESARILSLSIFASRSHKNVYEPLLLELSRRGHQVTIVNPVRSSRPVGSSPNIRDILGIPSEQLLNQTGLNVFTMTDELSGSMWDKLGVWFRWLPTTQARCAEFYALPQIQAVLREPFDLILFNPVSNECLLGMVHSFGAPSIFVTTLTAPYWVVGPTLGGPTSMSTVPLFFADTGDRMTFCERLEACLCHAAMTAYLDYYFYPTVEAVYRAQFGVSTPGVHEILRNASLIMSNSHYSLNFPRPTMPNDVEVGGMHCRPAQPLPKDLEDFIAGSGEHGLVYFSMGSMIQANVMPDRFRNIFLHTFSRLKQRVLWKWENETLGGVQLPENMRVSPWVPQQDVLGHDKIRLFITHGGLLSTEEAVYHGVPLLGFPMYGDQLVNMKHAVKMGFALKLDFGSLTEEILMEAITRILGDSRFKTQAEIFSSSFRDRPQSALDLAVYWTEYVLRHSGAAHLRSPARQLSFWAYTSLDVLGFLVFTLSAILYVSFKIVQGMFRLVCCSTSASAQSKKREQSRAKIVKSRKVR